jgi:hypothetical protein
MNRTFKTLLLWLLMAVLPVQGLAAAIKASCGPAHHTSLPVVSMVAQHHHDSDAAHGHHHDDATGQSAASTADDTSSDALATASDSSSISKSSYCSACAACCIGAVAPPTVLIWTPARGSSESVVLSPMPLVTGYIPSGLERPPRHIFA